MLKVPAQEFGLAAPYEFIANSYKNEKNFEKIIFPLKGIARDLGV